ncbi:LD-carboxypeptidase [Kitasatospora sp. NPDC048365]|uniref:S66 peptidase family protein n=1 Tax=Kitasatospora sp. NPDC048365 TaxID=3364050 RepID=UPI0037246B50
MPQPPAGPADARPRRLVPGDRVALIAPSGAVAEPGLLAAGTELLRSWGLDVLTLPHVHDTHPDLVHLAGTDAHRAADFHRAWLDPSVAAIICVRGGFGVQRMIDLLDWDALRAAPPKTLVGYSDITVLHEAVHTRLGVPTLYGPMAGIGAFTSDHRTADHLRRTLFHPETTTVIRSDGTAPLVPGRARGTLAGGCVSLLASERGTPTARPSFAGTLLVLEDVNEQPYQLDRILTQLLRSGALDGVAGVVLGSWESCGPPEDVHRVMEDRLAPLGVPVLWNLAFGHGPSALTIPLGVPAVLDATAGTLTLDQPVLSTPNGQ